MQTRQILSALALLFLTAEAKPTTGYGHKSPKHPVDDGGEAPCYPSAPVHPPADYPSIPKPGNNLNLNFTSTIHVKAVPGEVVNGTAPTGGIRGAAGYYSFGLNAEEDLICYSIRLRGVTGEYASPARTATHIHQAARGASGPPRIALANPVPDPDDPTVRFVFDCQRGPFRTGLNDTVTGADTGEGFTVAMIEADPAAFFADTHTADALPGAVRGQLA